VTIGTGPPLVRSARSRAIALLRMHYGQVALAPTMRPLRWMLRTGIHVDKACEQVLAMVRTDGSVVTSLCTDLRTIGSASGLYADQRLWARVAARGTTVLKRQCPGPREVVSGPGHCAR
jgi:hypothetical protein